jgi:hypothetical protein
MAPSLRVAGKIRPYFIVGLGCGACHTRRPPLRLAEFFLDNADDPYMSIHPRVCGPDTEFPSSQRDSWALMHRMALAALETKP